MAAVQDDYEPQNGSPVVDFERAGASNIRLNVRNFGPVALADIDVKPLTVFIGPNNSGKSYIALLIYVLSKALTAQFSGFFPFSTIRAFRDYFYAEFDKNGAFVSFSDIAESDQVSLKREMDILVSRVEQSILANLTEYFGVGDLARLGRAGSSPDSFEARVVSPTADESGFVRISTEDQLGTIRVNRPVLESLRIPVWRNNKILPEELKMRFAAEQLWAQLASEHGFRETSEYYLPPARSGILTTWPLVTSMAIGAVRQRLGPEPIQLAALSGVVGDFLQHLLTNFMADGSLGQSREGGMDRVLEVLEGDILQGSVSIKTAPSESGLLQYEGATVVIPVQSASSMVAELAPLDLWVRQMVRPGDFLIIDEPEAHLHPRNQRHMARVLVRLVRAGVRVICPTHSSLIVHQLSNHILAANAPDAERKRLGFTEDDVLESSEIGVYLFDNAGQDGTIVRPVEITEDFGISEDEFVAVAEQIGDESYRLAAAGSPGS
ncbi:MAG: AAA family ATPase [Chloroflexia bacterium]|nr:AAA family ATPase [Chloroflexia bacterium]